MIQISKLKSMEKRKPNKEIYYIYKCISVSIKSQGIGFLHQASLTPKCHMCIYSQYCAQCQRVNIQILEH